MSQAGWYQVDCFARVIAPAPSIDLVTLIDDRPLGFTTAVLRSGRFRRRLVSKHSSPALAATRWVSVFMSRVRLLSIGSKSVSVAAPLALTPRIVSLAAPSAEVVVADAVVTDAPFLADPTGARDSTQAFTDALAAVSAYGGGTVFAPAGIYRIDGTLVIPGARRCGART